MTIHNPWWQVARNYVHPATFGQVGLEIGGMDTPGGKPYVVDDQEFPAWNYLRFREFAVHRWAWTVTDPETVKFVVEHCGPRVIDPMAGTGYWGYLLKQFDVDVLSSDIDPPGPFRETNIYHPDTEPFVKISRCRADAAVRLADHDRTLFLAWPPMDNGAAQCLRAYPGKRLIHIGEFGGCTADEDFFAELDKNWTEVKTHRPVQFFGLHDYVTVFDRIRALPGV